MSQWLKNGFGLNLNTGFNRGGWERICARDWKRPERIEDVRAGKSSKKEKKRKDTKLSKGSKGAKASKGGAAGKRRR